jgi:death on curing protein
MTDTLYLTADDVWAINDRILRAYGQTTLLLNRGSLESALLRAQNAAYYQQADVVEQAAVLIAGIAFAHAFLDGNKRTAVVAGSAFLDRNGFHVAATGDEFGRQIEAMVRHAGSQNDATKQFLEWLRSAIEPLP